MSIIGRRRFYPLELRPSIIRRDERREMEEGRAKKATREEKKEERGGHGEDCRDVQGMVEDNANGWKDGGGYGERKQVGVERVRWRRERERERERKRGGVEGFGVIGGRESEMKVGDERDCGVRWSGSERERGGERDGLDDVILDIRWNLHCASTLVIPHTQTVQ